MMRYCKREEWFQFISIKKRFIFIYWIEFGSSREDANCSTQNPLQLECRALNSEARAHKYSKQENKLYIPINIDIYPAHLKYHVHRRQQQRQRWDFKNVIRLNITFWLLKTVDVNGILSWMQFTLCSAFDMPSSFFFAFAIMGERVQFIATF